MIGCFARVARARVLIVLLTLAHLAVLVTRATAQPVRPGTAAPPIVLASLDGDTVSLTGLGRHPVILKFWASWCPTCRAEMNQLLTAQQMAPSIRVLAVNADEPAERVRRYLAKEQLTLPFKLLMDPNSKVSRRYRILGLPTTIFLDEDGIVRTVHAGALSPMEFAKGLASILPPTTKDKSP
jgi:thiol-disulfide isomerase/thioredoxin